MSFNILVLGAGGNAGLNILKCLKKSTYDIHLSGTDIDYFNHMAIPCKKKILLPFNDVSKKTELLLEFIKKENIHYIHPQPDLEVKYLLEHKDIFKNLIFDHNLDIWNKFSNKLYCQNIWGKAFNKPYLAYSLQEVMKVPNLFKKLKGAQEKVWIRLIQGAGSRGSLPVTSLEQAISWATYWVENKNYSFEMFMLCEYLPHDEYAVQTFWVKGELVQSQARKRLVYFFETIMPSGQSSTPAVAITENDPSVYKAAYKAITSIDSTPHGIYCVDLKRDQYNDVIPMEVNYGRFFTTSDFFAQLNVNTPLAVFEYFMFKKKTVAIETIKDSYYWLRGIDKDPTIHKANNDVD